LYEQIAKQEQRWSAISLWRHELQVSALPHARPKIPNPI